MSQAVAVRTPYEAEVGRTDADLQDNGIPDYIRKAADLAAVEARSGGTGSHNRKFNAESVTRLLMYVLQGNYYEVACRASGISVQTFNVWRHKGEQELEAGQFDSPYARFVEALKRAEAEDEISDVACVRAAARASDRNWAAAMTKLERRHQDRWGRSERHELSYIKITVGQPERGLTPPVINAELIQDDRPALSPPPGKGAGER